MLFVLYWQRRFSPSNVHLLWTICTVYVSLHTPLCEQIRIPQEGSPIYIPWLSWICLRPPFSIWPIQDDGIPCDVSARGYPQPHDGRAGPVRRGECAEDREESCKEWRVGQSVRRDTRFIAESSPELLHHIRQLWAHTAVGKGGIFFGGTEGPMIGGTVVDTNERGTALDWKS